MADLLKLIAEDEDDLKALSALVQDAVLQVGDIAFLPKARRFALVLNRFRWEAGKPGGRGTRVRAGLRIENVVSARQSGLKQDAKEVVLNLLALDFAAWAEGGGALTLAFSGGGRIELHVEALEAHLDDLSGPWSARGRPDHALD